MTGGRLGTAVLKRLWKSRLYIDWMRAHHLKRGQPDWEHLTSQARDLPVSTGGTDDGRGRVLVATVLGGYLVGSHVESLLALALKARGADVHVLLCDGVMPACQQCTIDWYPDERRFAEEGPTARHCRTCFTPAKDMYSALGVVVHRYSDLVTPAEAGEAARIARQIPVLDIPTYEVDGVQVGEHANAGALRFYGRGSLPPEREPETVLRRYLEAALLTRFATDRLLARERFDCAVFHHGIYVPQGVVGDTARRRNVRVVNWNVAYRKNCFVFSHGDTYHHTLLSEPTSEWENLPWSDTLDRELGEYLRSRWHGTNDWITFARQPELSAEVLMAETGVDLSKPCIGMLTNVIWDAQLHYKANAFPTLLAWAEKTIGYFATRPELELLIRVHPAELTGMIRSRQPFLECIGKAFPVLPPNVHVIPPESNLSTYAAMEQCNTVLIYGTKTGVELSATGIPVIVAGEAWVRNKGITMDAVSEEDYFRLLDQLPLAGRLEPATVERARRYAYHFFFRRMIPLEFATEAVGSQDFSWEVDSLSDLAPGSSRGLDVICDGILQGRPFVYPAEEQALAPVSDA